MFKWELILLLVIYICNSSCLLDNMYSTGIEILKLYSKLDGVGPRSPYNIDELFSSNNKVNLEINTQLDQINQHLHEVGEVVNSGKFGLLLNNIPIDIYLDPIQLFIMNIDESFREFHLYKNGSKSTSTRTFRNFMCSVIPKLEGDIAIVRKKVIEKNELLPDHENLLHAISSYAAAHNTEMCNGPQIISTALFRLFRNVMIAVLEANTIVAFANMYRYSPAPGWGIMNSIARETFKEQFSVYVKSFAETSYMVDPVYLRACDPDDGIWHRNENFYELERTFQATIFRYHWGTCKYNTNCNDLMSETEDRCERRAYDSRSACSHTPDDCAYLGGIKACVLESGPYRFQYLNSTKLGSFGRNFECPKNNSHLIEDGTGMNYVYAACVCNCHSNQNKISILLMKSNVASNKVITGLRFIRKNQILYIQPREGTLGAHGYILKSSESWMNLPKNAKSSDLRGVDKDYRAFFLDDLRLPPYYVLTGVKFSRVTRQTIRGYAIGIAGVPFDYESGMLLLDSKFASFRQVSRNFLGEKLEFEPVSSIHTKLRHTPPERNMKYVLLERSNLDDDFGQSTLPFFDAVPIRVDPPSPLGGIGIFHKGADGYAGFISIKVFAIEYNFFFNDFQHEYMADGEISFNYSKSN